MTPSRTANWLLCVILSIFVIGISPALADDGDPSSLADVHKILLQALGDPNAAPPTAAQQTELLKKALAVLAKVPRVYHGQLKAAKTSLESALDELSTGDTAHKAKRDIYDADDTIKSLM